MEDEFEAMKLFKDHDRHSMVLVATEQPHIIAALKRLLGNSMIVCCWTLNQEFPFDCELTEKGHKLTDYLRANEWE